MDNDQPINTVGEFEDKFNGFFADKHLSAAGRERVQQSMHLLSSYVKLNNVVIENDGALAGIIVILIQDALKGLAQVGLAEIRDNTDKDALFADIDRMVDELSHDAVITIAEAWVAVVERGENIACSPSQHPQRKEAVITSLHMNIDFKPCVVTAMQEISRDGGQAKLLSPQFGFVSGEEISGRMTGFEKSLCPIA